MLLLFSYAFMLRVPSEAVPATFCGGSFTSACAHAVSLTPSRLGVRLAKRKNLQQGAPPLFRQCWCEGSPSTCPIHVFGKFAAARGVGQRLFPGVTPASAIGVVRACLRAADVPEATRFGTHDLRRGHALDLVKRGGRLGEILREGQWASGAALVKSYLPFDILEAEAVLEAAVADSGSEDDAPRATAPPKKRGRPSHGIRARAAERSRRRQVVAAASAASAAAPA